MNTCKTCGETLPSTAVFCGSWCERDYLGNGLTHVLKCIRLRSIGIAQAVLGEV